MQLDELLDRLKDVRPRAQGRWTAKCPAHADKTPSLSIKEGERALLVRCFAGCSLEEICDSLGLKVADLFVDARVDSEAKKQRDEQRRERERQWKRDGLRLDALREAEATIAAAYGLDISCWTNEQMGIALNALADAYDVLEREGVLYE